MSEIGTVENKQGETALSQVTVDMSEKARGRPRSAQKNESILSAASALFMENGFDGTSMDEVAKRAGVSKQTVYSHFSNKEALFSASITNVIRGYFPDLEDGATFCSQSLEDDLRKICETFTRLFISDDAIGMFRLLASSATLGGENKLARLFWDAGPEFMLEQLSQVMEFWAAQGQLKMTSGLDGAKTLISLIKGPHHFQMAIGLIDHVSEKEISEHAANCTQLFLKIYGS